MVEITNNTQLSTFELIRDILLSNSVLSVKFNINNMFEIEPKHKSVSFSGYPYIWIKVPSSEPEDENYVGNIIERRMFVVEITLRMDYEARKNYTSFANNIVSSLRGALTTFKESSYDLGDVKHEMGPEVILINQKDTVEGLFNLELTGDVTV